MEGIDKKRVTDKSKVVAMGIEGSANKIAVGIVD